MQRRNALSVLRAKCARPLAAVAAVLALAALPTTAPPAAAQSPEAPSAAAAGFTVFTNERGAHPPGHPQYGATKATVVYDVFAYTCDAVACYSNGSTTLPSQATYEAKVKEYMGASQFGGDPTAPVVLDFEAIEMTQLSNRQAALKAQGLWRTLLTWTRNAAPQAPICHYGYDWLTLNQDLIEDLHDENLLNCFAPRAYFYDGQSLAAWDSDFDAAIARDRAMAPNHPIYPYVNPYSFSSQTYVPGNAWAHMFAKVKASADGVVIWESTANNANACAWVSQNSYEMGVITGTGSTGPFQVSATLPSGNCIVPRGTTTTVPVTLTNTSTATTPATQMQSFNSTPGFSGSWKYWNVPALAPGATWSTELPMAVAATQTTSTALLRIRTGISDTRWAVIVQ
ncbi:hypothetical protein [Streptomyces sp. FIT100]|uniref:hypothetical protein n=1 Tax=Streptomyces sp. FIT100 TaxID=2837956 RepID=UPI0021C6751A|nr:hypothetical protein [Streptomyces sp. FIT100]UUN30629.1 hypothetical protein KK483_33055 [Streptomyces sp. FIT100]